jgi:hypothetical protein
MTDQEKFSLALDQLENALQQVKLHLQNAEEELLNLQRTSKAGDDDTVDLDKEATLTADLNLMRKRVEKLESLLSHENGKEKGEKKHESAMELLQRMHQKILDAEQEHVKRQLNSHQAHEQMLREKRIAEELHKSEEEKRMEEVNKLKKNLGFH